MPGEPISYQWGRWSKSVLEFRSTLVGLAIFSHQVRQILDIVWWACDIWWCIYVNVSKTILNSFIDVFGERYYNTNKNIFGKPKIEPDISMNSDSNKSLSKERSCLRV